MDVDVEPEVVSAEYVQQLEDAIMRIRSERNELRTENASLHRDFEFLQVESRFTIQSLQKQLHQDTHTHEPRHIGSTLPTLFLPYIARLQKTALATAIVAQHSDEEREMYASQLGSASQALQRTLSRAQEAERAVGEQHATIQSMKKDDMEMRDSLATAEFKLSSSERRVSDLQALVDRLGQELEESGAAQDLLSDTSAQSEARLADAARQLDDAQTERSSLALQVKHLQQDLEAVREELTGAESRYSQLQGQQLATMSSNEASRALRRQIEELEQRVNRRTEQIGIHQHDIKRLETNLRLQEERLLEMTGELEVAESEKLAMIEDCKTTREARDRALERCEELEETVEELEQRLASAGVERETELAAMVGVVVDSRARRQQAAREFARAVTRRDLVLHQLTSRAEEAERSVANSQAIAEQHAASYRATVAQLEKLQQEAEWLQTESVAAAQGSTQSTVALAAVIREAQTNHASWQATRTRKDQLQAELRDVKEQLENSLLEFTALQSKQDALLRAHEDHDLKAQAIVEQRDELQQSLDTLQQGHDSALAELSQLKDELRAHISESADRLNKETALRAELEAMQQTFQTDADDLRTELAHVAEELEAAEMQRASTASAHRQALDELVATKEELEQSLMEAQERLAQKDHAEDELTLLREGHAAEVEATREELDHVRHQLEEVTKARDDLVAEQAVMDKELEELRHKTQDVTQSKEDLEAEVQALRLQHCAETKSLETRLQDALAEKTAAANTLSELETRLADVLREREELESEMAETKAALDSVQVEFKAESDRFTRESADAAADLKAALQKQSNATAAQSDLESELSALQDRLREAGEELSTAQAERDDAQMQHTSLQADLHRSLSLQRSHESKIEECNRTINDLRQKLNVARADNALSEQASKSAEMQLTLQTVKHKEVVEALNRQLANLQGSEKLQETILDLQERCQELEGLLQQKNAEIEENDDRFIQHNKERKKFNAKVDNLSRKVKTLQDKLAASSQESTPKATSAPVAPPAPASHTPSSPPAPTMNRPLVVRFEDPVASTSRARSETVPIVTRTETPEASRPVFRPRTPEPRKPPPDRPLPPIPDVAMVPREVDEDLQPPFQESSSSCSIGKKRRAPDDFEDSDSVPVQYFSIDSVPVGQAGGRTPRSRRGPQTGFTPMRGGSSRPAPVPPTSPRRTAGSAQLAAPLIADVTNSPRSKGGALKKGWLKMKPNATQAAGAARASSSSRPGIGNRTQNQ